MALAPLLAPLLVPLLAPLLTTGSGAGMSGRTTARRPPVMRSSGHRSGS
jgi:hypothetical protein